MAGPIRIAVLANASQARGELERTASTAQRIESRFSRLRLPAMAALGGIAAGAWKSVNAASDLNEETSKSEVIFGKQAKAIQRWAATADTSLGQSQKQALDAASTFGQIAQKAGLGGKASAKFGMQFSGLASDLASFNNTTPEEAITAIGAAMRGESEPIRRYGVQLDDATLRARALRMGLVKTTKEALTPQQKALAASREIWAQTGKAQGDFARTADGPANKSRIVAAQVENLSAKLGQSLLPAYASILGVASSVAGYFSEHTGQAKALVIAVGALATAVLAASVATKLQAGATAIAAGATRAWAAAQWAARTAMGVASLVHTIALLGAHGAALALDKARTLAHAAAQRAAAVATRGMAVAQRILNVAMRANPIGIVITVIAALVAIVVVAWKKNETFRRVVTSAWNAIKAVAGRVWSWIVGAISGAARKIVNTGNAIKSGIVNAWNKAKELTVRAWQALIGAVVSKIAAVIAKVRGLKDRVVGALGAAGKWLVGAGKSLISGLWNGISSMGGWLRDKIIGFVADKIPGPVRKALGISSPSRVFAYLGRMTTRGLAAGVADRGELRKVERASATMTKAISLRGVSRLPSRSTYAATLAASASSSSGGDVRVRLTAEQISQLQRGREIALDLEAWRRVGGAR